MDDEVSLGCADEIRIPRTKYNEVLQPAQIMANMSPEEVYKNLGTRTIVGGPVIGGDIRVGRIPENLTTGSTGTLSRVC